MAGGLYIPKDDIIHNGHIGVRFARTLVSRWSLNHETSLLLTNRNIRGHCSVLCDKNCDAIDFVFTKVCPHDNNQVVISSNIGCHISVSHYWDLLWASWRLNALNYFSWLTTKKTFALMARCDGRVCVETCCVEAEWRIYASVKHPSLIRIIARCLVGAKSLTEPMLEYS